jgi:hypothetical protein
VTPPARDDRRWTLAINEHGSVVGGWAPGVECVEVMPVAAHEAEMARRSRVDHAEAERLHAELEQARTEHEAALAAARQVDPMELAQAVTDELRLRFPFVLRDAPVSSIAVVATDALLTALTAPEPEEKR